MNLMKPKTDVFDEDEAHGDILDQEHEDFIKWLTDMPDPLDDLPGCDLDLDIGGDVD